MVTVNALPVFAGVKDMLTFLTTKIGLAAGGPDFGELAGLVLGC